MLRKRNDVAAREMHDLHSGKGTIYSYDFLSPEELCNKGRLFSRTVLPAGASIGMHTHKGEFEAYYVISGTGVVNDGTRDYVVEPGDVYYCENGGSHQLTNDGAEELAILAVILYA